MTRVTDTDRRASVESGAAGFSRFSLSSRGEGESGRMRENRIAILPHASDCSDSDLQRSRENRENSLLLHTCAGAARGNSELDTAQDVPFSPESPPASNPSPPELLWTALTNKEDIYAMAYRLRLPPSDPVESWRLAVLRIAKSEAFLQTKPPEIRLRHEDWQRWRSLSESPRKMFDLLRKLIYGVRIWG